MVRTAEKEHRFDPIYPLARLPLRLFCRRSRRPSFLISSASHSAASPRRRSRRPVAICRRSLESALESLVFIPSLHHSITRPLHHWFAMTFGLLARYRFLEDLLPHLVHRNLRLALPDAVQAA